MKSDKRRSSRSPMRTGLELNKIEPLTENQALAFKSNKHLVLDGWAGTGKTFISSYLGFDDVINNHLYSKLIYIRSTVATRTQGFLKGDLHEKEAVYETPYIDIVGELHGRGDAYDILKLKGVVKFMSTSFIRGTTMRDAVVIVDETQNMNYHELDTIITRIGENCRIIFCGDYAQVGDDLGAKQTSGIRDFNAVLREMNEFDFISFTKDDIVRGPLVKNYLVTKHAVHGDRQFS